MSKTKKPNRVALYARVSTTNGQDVGLQLDELRAVAEQREWEIVGEFVDEGISGAQEDRPALDQMLALAWAGKIDLVAVWKLDRLARSLVHLLRLLDELKGLGVGFVSVRDTGLDTTTAPRQAHAQHRGIQQIVGDPLTLVHTGPETVADVLVNGAVDSAEALGIRESLEVESGKMGTCIAQCIEATDPLGPTVTGALAATGGPVPKAVAKKLGVRVIQQQKASRVTTLPSMVSVKNKLGARSGVRATGGVAQGAFIGYGVIMSGATIACVAACVECDDE